MDPTATGDDPTFGGGPLQGAPAIVTPDAVGLDVEVATVGTRGIAYIIDLAIFGVVLFFLSLTQAVLGGAGFVPGWLAIAILLVLTFAWQFGYPIGFETLWRGRTPGKAVMGLRVVTVEGGPIRFRHAAIRAVIGIVELLSTMGVPAILTCLTSSRSQRLGDMAAGTIVVRSRARRAIGVPTAEVWYPPRGLEAYVAQLDVSAIGSQEYALIRETLRRGAQLPPQIAAKVSDDLAVQIRDRVQPAPPPGCPPEVFLTAVAAAVQQRRRHVVGRNQPPVPLQPSARVFQVGADPAIADTARQDQANGDKTGFAPPA